MYVRTAAAYAESTGKVVQVEGDKTVFTFVWALLGIVRCVSCHVEYSAFNGY